MSTWVIIPSDDDIEHSFHKYIDKIRTASGKWRYIYYKAKKKANRFIGTEQKNKLDRANIDYEGAKENQKGARKATHKFIENELKYKRFGIGMDDHEKEKLESSREWHKEDMNAADRIVEKTKRKQEAAQEAYDKTLLGKIDQVKDAGLKAWDSFTSLFKKETSNSRTVTNNNKGTAYTPSYSTKKSPTTLTRGTAYSPSYKKGPTTSSRGTAYTPPNTQPRLNIRTSSATSFMRNNSNKASSNKGGLVSSSKQNPGVAIGADVINKDKKKKRRRA